MIHFLATLFSNATIATVLAVVAGIGLVRVYGADLPGHDDLVDYQPPLLTRVYSGEGEVIAEFARERRIFAPIDEIPPLVRNAFISAEDKHFYTHPGVDAEGIVKAITRFAMARAAGQPARLTGASTISQQVMKNFLVGNARSVERKIKEAILAVRVDGALSKDHILELYLNDIYLGARSYGVAAAAQNYFGKSLEALTLPEAAYLAALPKAPSDLHPVRAYDRSVARRNYVLEEMAQNGYITRSEAEEAKGAPLVTLLEDEGAPPVQRTQPDYFTAEVRRQLVSEVGSDMVYEGGLTVRATVEPDLQQLAGQALRKALESYDRRRGVYRGPIATIGEVDGDGGWVAKLDRVVLPHDVPGWHPAVVLEVDRSGATLGVLPARSDLADADPVPAPPEGEATVASADGPAAGTPGPEEVRIGMEGTDWIRTVVRDGRRRGAPGGPGDLYKPGDVILVSREGEGWRLRQLPEIQGAFMAMDPHTGRVLALQGGFSYEGSRFNRATQALRQPGSSFKPFVYAAALDAGYSPSTVVLDAPVVVRLAGGDWRPKNSSDKFYGPTPLRLGIVYSRNLMTVRVAQAIGMRRVADYAERFGVYDDMPMHLSYALGAGETTLYDMVAAYGMFANGGKRVRPTLVDRIQDRNGHTLFRHDPRICQGCEADRLRAGRDPVLFDGRERIMNPITARQLVEMMQGVVEYGTAARTVGGLGFPVAGKTGTTNESRDAWFIGFTPNLVAGCFIGFDTPRPMGKGAYGGTLCGPVFREFMEAAMRDRSPGTFFEAPEDSVVLVKVDRNSGMRLPDDATGDNVIVQSYRIGTEPGWSRPVQQIASDVMLFGGSAETLPFRISERGTDLSSGDGGGGVAVSGGGNQSQGAAPRRPRPSGAGLDSGGLY